MTEEEAFLQAVADAPDDDAPRQIYADWLEERGRTERAEIIRVQCALEQLAADDPQRPALEARERELLGPPAGYYQALARWPEWMGPLPEPRPDWCRESVEFMRFRRGFVEEVGVRGEAFVAEPEAVFRLGPVRHVELITWATAAQLAAMPQLLQLNTLRVGMGLSDGDEGVQALAASPFLTRLRALDLSECRLSGVALQALAESPSLAGLEVLHLRGNGLAYRHEGLRSLLESPRLPQLKELDLSGRMIGNEYQSISRNVGEEGVILLAQTPGAAKLRRLNLALNEIGDPGWEALVRSPHLDHLEWLNVDEFVSPWLYLDPCLQAISEPSIQALRARFGDRVVIQEYDQ